MSKIIYTARGTRLLHSIQSIMFRGAAASVAPLASSPVVADPVPIATPVQNANAWASFAAPSIAPSSVSAQPVAHTAVKSALWASARQEVEQKQERERERRAEVCLIMVV